MIKTGCIVETPHGVGKIVKEEVFRTCERWGVELHNNPFTFPIAYYFKNEIKKELAAPKSDGSEAFR